MKIDILFLDILTIEIDYSNSELTMLSELKLVNLTNWHIPDCWALALYTLFKLLASKSKCSSFYLLDNIFF